jgi:hypothetical protein
MHSRNPIFLLPYFSIITNKKTQKKKGNLTNPYISISLYYIIIIIISWAPRAVHGDGGLHCACYFNRGPMWTPSRPPARQNHSGFGVAVLNCMRKFKNRPFWTALSSLQCAACHVLAALSALQLRPHVPLFENCVYYVHIWWILKHMCRVAACEAESLVSSKCTYALIV